MYWKKERNARIFPLGISFSLQHSFVSFPCQSFRSLSFSLHSPLLFFSPTIFRYISLLSFPSLREEKRQPQEKRKGEKDKEMAKYCGGSLFMDTFSSLSSFYFVLSLLISFPSSLYFSFTSARALPRRKARNEKENERGIRKENKSKGYEMKVRQAISVHKKGGWASFLLFFYLFYFLSPPALRFFPSSACARRGRKEKRK